MAKIPHSGRSNPNGTILRSRCPTMPGTHTGWTRSGVIVCRWMLPTPTKSTRAVVVLMRRSAAAAPRVPARRLLAAAIISSNDSVVSSATRFENAVAAVFALGP